MAGPNTPHPKVPGAVLLVLAEDYLCILASNRRRAVAISRVLGKQVMICQGLGFDIGVGIITNNIPCIIILRKPPQNRILIIEAPIVCLELVASEISKEV